jgi:hypothetical protein
MRNFLAAAAMAERDRKRFIGILAISPELCSEILGSQIEGFRQTILRPAFRDHVKFLTYETLISHLRDVEAAGLADFLSERIDTICHGAQP